MLTTQIDDKKPSSVTSITQVENTCLIIDILKYNFRTNSGIGVLFLKGIVIGKNVTGIFSYFSITFSITLLTV